MNKIFLIDDDEDDQFMFKEVVKSIDPSKHCEIAVNGKNALEILKLSDYLPDIIFLDLNMPIMNGYDFLIQVKKEKKLKKIPVGIFSTSNNSHDKQITKEFGAQFFLTKPTDFQTLRKQLLQILSSDFLCD